MSVWVRLVAGVDPEDAKKHTPWRNSNESRVDVGGENVTVATFCERVHEKFAILLTGFHHSQLDVLWEERVVNRDELLPPNAGSAAKYPILVRVPMSVGDHPQDQTAHIEEAIRQIDEKLSNLTLKIAQFPSGTSSFSGSGACLSRGCVSPSKSSFPTTDTPSSESAFPFWWRIPTVFWGRSKASVPEASRLLDGGAAPQAGAVSIEPTAMESGVSGASRRMSLRRRR
eukprot:GDKH01000404.1.p1 GENE.GDKH01000404.1~~GDKH01000404.1.p1  ORF type:complete len:228 (-),score=2.94 GDKH01000404.1:252-935(-)